MTSTELKTHKFRKFRYNSVVKVMVSLEVDNTTKTGSRYLKFKTKTQIKIVDHQL